MEIPNENRREYMATYMRQRYNDNLERERAYKRTINLKKKNIVLDATDEQEFGVYLADILKLRKIIQTIPQDLLNKVIQIQIPQQV
jgi:hypothetical protein